jgi:hypothetical protein
VNWPTSASVRQQAGRLGESDNGFVIRVDHFALPLKTLVSFANVYKVTQK